ncbi:hypothetical protein E2C01_042193 [Portunus trituberculatus]|uniref:Uncharacterized protein n=1 Tax=Portunus trituberculatus TaxID=210409 RepID=A0A5B7FLU2_PORTR|nr:hypothetical protein [Portunus trituberculatus]
METYKHIQTLPATCNQWGHTTTQDVEVGICRTAPTPGDRLLSRMMMVVSAIRLPCLVASLSSPHVE